MNLIIDIGNTTAKVAVYDNEVVEDYRFEKFVVDHLKIIIRKYPLLNNAILSSTSTTDTELIEYCEKEFNTFIYLSHTTPIPIRNGYESPSLGKDRLAIAVGANSMFPDSNVLVFDLGTAITIDFISEDNEFMGGNISPGLNMRYKAMNHYTANLPLLKKSKKYSLIGRNTNNAIIFGVQTGILFEIEKYIDVFSTKYNDLKIILTGGDADLFVNEIKSCIFVVPKLVFEGLNKILLHNV